jgi:hypothetical protein
VASRFRVSISSKTHAAHSLLQRCEPCIAPEGVIDAVEQLAPDGFDNIEHVLSYSQREAIVRGYASKAGFATVPRLAAVQA